MREALNSAMFEEMARDPNVFVIGEEVALQQACACEYVIRIDSVFNELNCTSYAMELAAGGDLYAKDELNNRSIN